MSESTEEPVSPVAVVPETTPLVTAPPVKAAATSSRSDGRKKPRTVAQKASFEKARAAQKTRESSRKDMTTFMHMLSDMTDQYKQQRRQPSIRQQQPAPLPPDIAGAGSASEGSSSDEEETMNVRPMQVTVDQSKKKLKQKQNHKTQSQPSQSSSHKRSRKSRKAASSSSSSSESSSSSSGSEMDVAVAPRDWDREKKHFGYNKPAPIKPRKPGKRAQTEYAREQQQAEPDNEYTAAQLRQREFQSRLGF